MIATQKIAVVMPAYNAGKTLEKTYLEIPRDIVDEVILVDDKSKDNTVEEARRLGIEHIVQHDDNLGYGGNQKSCYSKALELDCDIVIMVHPDYQYTPLLIAPMAHIIANGVYPVVFGSRILGKGQDPNAAATCRRQLLCFVPPLLEQRLVQPPDNRHSQFPRLHVAIADYPCRLHKVRQM